jgi:hypothetical protein
MPCGRWLGQVILTGFDAQIRIEATVGTESADFIDARDKKCL